MCGTRLLAIGCEGLSQRPEVGLACLGELSLGDRQGKMSRVIVCCRRQRFEWIVGIFYLCYFLFLFSDVV